MREWLDICNCGHPIDEHINKKGACKISCNCTNYEFGISVKLSDLWETELNRIPIVGEGLFCKRCDKQMKISMLGGGQEQYKCPKCDMEVVLAV